MIYLNMRRVKTAHPAYAVMPGQLCSRGGREFGHIATPIATDDRWIKNVGHELVRYRGDFKVGEQPEF
jgi:hypothetical protein